MTVRAWAIKPSELKRLDRDARIAFLVRCAQRVAPWAPSTAESRFYEGLALLTRPDPRPELVPLARAIRDLGAAAHRARSSAGDEPLATCENYATQVLGEALEVSATTDMTKGLVLVAKLAGSIPAVLAHAGRVPVGEGEDAVAVAAGAMWDAMRSDLRALASGADALAETPLWSTTPTWVPETRGRSA